jgi:hypothetical protein
MGEEEIRTRDGSVARLAEAHDVHSVPGRRVRARVTIGTRPMWRIRLARELPRALLLGASLAGLLASARFAIDPPRPAAPPASGAAVPPQDLAAEGFAQLFARRYLTWEAGDPEAHRRALAPFVRTGMEADAGLQLPSSGAERVQWTEVVQERIPSPGERVYTVAVQTDANGLVYLTVSVQRAADGALRLAGYPAFVGAPATEPGSVADGLREVTDSALRTVVARALRNYLAGAGAELAADLSSAARVALPAQPLSLEAVARLDWSAEGGDAVTATVQVHDAHGARYTLAYDLDMTEVAGRWEVAAIQMDPNS